MGQHHNYRFGTFLVDREGFQLYRDRRKIHLEPMVFKLLVYLIDNRDRLILRQELIDSVWRDKVISDSALDKAVARLRSALNDNAARPRYHGRVLSPSGATRKARSMRSGICSNRFIAKRPPRL